MFSVKFKRCCTGTAEKSCDTEKEVFMNENERTAVNQLKNIREVSAVKLKKRLTREVQMQSRLFIFQI